MLQPFQSKATFTNNEILSSTTIFPIKIINWKRFECNSWRVWSIVDVQTVCAQNTKQIDYIFQCQKYGISMSFFYESGTPPTYNFIFIYYYSSHTRQNLMNLKMCQPKFRVFRFRFRPFVMQSDHRYCQVLVQGNIFKWNQSQPQLDSMNRTMI